MEEIWKDIKGYEGLYQVSNLGRIKSCKYNKIMKSNKSDRYLGINLYKNGKPTTFDIHRIVAKTFIDNPNNYPIVNHIDGNKLNNNVDNLEWCTQSHNVKESYKLGLQKVKTPSMLQGFVPWNKGKKMTHEFIIKNCNSKKVNQYNTQGEYIKTWDTIKDAEITLNTSHISDCCRGKRNTAGGYIWRYAEK